MKYEQCKHTPEMAAEQAEAWDEIEPDIRAAGGTLTRDGWAHSCAFDKVATAWTGARARAWIKRERKHGKWLGAHAHEDGSIFVPVGSEDARAG